METRPLNCIEKSYIKKVRDEPETWIPELIELEGLTLGCWNHPGVPCHGDVIADLVVRPPLVPKRWTNG